MTFSPLMTFLAAALLASAVEFTAPAAAALDLTPEERAKLHQSIIVMPYLPPPPKDWRPAVGDGVPEAVKLYTVPVSLKIPVVIRYRYAVVENKVVLADPLTRKVVEIIDGK